MGSTEEDKLKDAARWLVEMMVEHGVLFPSYRFETFGRVYEMRRKAHAWLTRRWMR